MNSSVSGSLSSVPNGRIIDFESAELRQSPMQDELYLLVTGKLPAIDFEVKLAPRVYFDRPDYWGIEVAAVVLQPLVDGKTANASQLKFEKSVPLSGIIGNRGITVIGANQVKRIEISGATGSGRNALE
jgi:hypothetical protein